MEESRRLLMMRTLARQPSYSIGGWRGEIWIAAAPTVTIVPNCWCTEPPSTPSFNGNCPVPASQGRLHGTGTVENVGIYSITFSYGPSTADDACSRDMLEKVLVRA